MAKGVLSDNLSNISVISAGCGALAGKGADPVAIELMAERGIDISLHIAADLNIEHAMRSQLILAMTLEQKKEIERRYPFSKGRVFLYSAQDGNDVIDPYRKGRDVFETSLAQIDRGAGYWVSAINRLRK
ncbi:protein-tyrosine phosphatase [Paraburkholderia bannensis]|uniref:protein-tyrosine-phosphatase n=2 Tax=Burkholderiaceae TaxID=119060 RepID=A0A7W9TSM3_9BURK|nr:protein-tyrosine phosphatase [Paraburkholderia sp. WP4_3_2]MBB6100756.1 protein-tyrosine phosphatase [Paraburkholderia bannensis]